MLAHPQGYTEKWVAFALLTIMVLVFIMWLSFIIWLSLRLSYYIFLIRHGIRQNLLLNLKLYVLRIPECIPLPSGCAIRHSIWPQIYLQNMIDSQPSFPLDVNYLFAIWTVECVHDNVKQKPYTSYKIECFLLIN